MGIFSRIWKGVKKTFKKIFSPIKRAFQKFGKFMGRLGVLGQIAMSFILPGVGNALLNTFGKAATWLSGGALGSVGKAAGWVLGKSVEFGKLAVQGYKTVTGAVTDFIGATGKYIGGKLGIGNLPNVSMDQAWKEYTTKLSDSFSKLGDSAKEFWDLDIDGAGPLKPVSMSKEQFEEQMTVDKDGNIVKKTTDPLKPTDEFTKTPSSIDGGRFQKVSNISEVSNWKELGFTTEAKEGFMGFEIDGQKLYLNPAADQSKLAASVDLSSLQEYSTGIVGEGVTKPSLLERVTGEKTFGDVGRKLATETRDYAYAAPGKAISSAVTTAGLQGLGLAAKPPGEPGPAWGSRVSFDSPSKYYGTEQILQPVGSIGFMDFVDAYAQGGEQMGTYGGQGFYSEYMRRFAAA